MFGDWKWNGLYPVRERRLLAMWVDPIEQAVGRGRGRARPAKHCSPPDVSASTTGRPKAIFGPFTDRMGKLLEQSKPTMFGAFRTLLENLACQKAPTPRASVRARSVWTLLR